MALPCGDRRVKQFERLRFEGTEMSVDLVEETPERWRIDPRGEMRVPGVVFASRDLLPALIGDRSL